jgi:hypothetical protein
MPYVRLDSPFASRTRSVTSDLRNASLDDERRPRLDPDSPHTTEFHE